MTAACVFNNLRKINYRCNCRSVIEERLNRDRVLRAHVVCAPLNSDCPSVCRKALLDIQLYSTSESSYTGTDDLSS